MSDPSTKFVDTPAGRVVITVVGVLILGAITNGIIMWAKLERLEAAQPLITQLEEEREERRRIQAESDARINAFELEQIRTTVRVHGAEMDVLKMELQNIEEWMRSHEDIHEDSQ